MTRQNKRRVLLDYQEYNARVHFQLLIRFSENISQIAHFSHSLDLWLWHQTTVDYGFVMNEAVENWGKFCETKDRVANIFLRL